MTDTTQLDAAWQAYRDSSPGAISPEAAYRAGWVDRGRQSPVTWHRGGNPPMGVEILFASDHVIGAGVVDADTPPVPHDLYWCLASEARAALVPGLARYRQEDKP